MLPAKPRWRTGPDAEYEPDEEYSSAEDMTGEEDEIDEDEEAAPEPEDDVSLVGGAAAGNAGQIDAEESDVSFIDDAGDDDLYVSEGAGDLDYEGAEIEERDRNVGGEKTRESYLAEEDDGGEEELGEEAVEETGLAKRHQRKHPRTMEGRSALDASNAKKNSEAEAWRPDEDVELEHLIGESVASKGRIDWDEVSDGMPARSRKGCVWRWDRICEARKGKAPGDEGAVPALQRKLHDPYRDSSTRTARGTHMVSARQHFHAAIARLFHTMSPLVRGDERTFHNLTPEDSFADLGQVVRDRFEAQSFFQNHLRGEEVRSFYRQHQKGQCSKLFPEPLPFSELLMLSANDFASERPDHVGMLRSDWKLGESPGRLYYGSRCWSPRQQAEYKRAEPQVRLVKCGPVIHFLWSDPDTMMLPILPVMANCASGTGTLNADRDPRREGDKDGVQEPEIADSDPDEPEIQLDSPETERKEQDDMAFDFSFALTKQEWKSVVGGKCAGPLLLMFTPTHVIFANLLHLWQSYRGNGDIGSAPSISQSGGNVRVRWRPALGADGYWAGALSLPLDDVDLQEKMFSRFEQMFCSVMDDDGKIAGIGLMEFGDLARKLLEGC